MDLIVSANDAKLVRSAGRDSFPEQAAPDTLTLIDAAQFPPRVLAIAEVATSIAGPPQAVALAPNGRVAIVSASNHYDRAAGTQVFAPLLQVVDLTKRPPRVVRRVDVGHHPQGVAINRDGTLLLAATTGGTVAVLTLHETAVELIDRVKLADGRLAGVSFTHDGRHALVALRDAQGVAVLAVEGTRVRDTGERVSTGVAPYAIDVSGDGRWAVVGNVGLAGLSAPAARLCADADSFTLIDVSRRPFRAVQHATVPSIPEGVAISPDGRWIAVLSMDGSNLTPDNPARAARGRLQLFDVRNGQADRVADLPAGESGQGVVFSSDSRLVFAQFFVERQIAVYAVNGGAMHDTGLRIEVGGGPASIRSLPR